jgi:hypothetical protein
VEKILNKEDVVAVFGGMRCGVCVYCKNRAQMCNFVKWPGITTNAVCIVSSGATVKTRLVMYFAISFALSCI